MRAGRWASLAAYAMDRALDFALTSCVSSSHFPLACSFACDNGYLLNGADEIHCQASAVTPATVGEWDAAPICARKSIAHFLLPLPQAQPTVGLCACSRPELLPAGRCARERKHHRSGELSQSPWPSLRRTGLFSSDARDEVLFRLDWDSQSLAPR